MIPFILREGLVPHEVLEDFEIAKAFIPKIPEATSEASNASKRRKVGGIEVCYDYYWSCHGVARAVQRQLLLQWRVIEGFFVNHGTEHAWLFLELDRSKFILDVYPYASVGGPFLLDAGSMSPWRDAYIERSMHYTAKEFEHFERQGYQIIHATY